jgi:hypothetical protein
MQILVSTKETQGNRDNDFSWVEEGEMVIFGFQCDGATPDDSCGCARSMVGIEKHKATTTVKVVEKDITMEDYITEVAKSNERAFPGIDPDGEVAKDDAKILLEVSSAFPVGSVLEIRGDTFTRRK